MIKDGLVYELTGRCSCISGNRFHKCRIITDAVDKRRLNYIEMNNKELVKPLEACDYKPFTVIMKELEEYYLNNESVACSSG